MYFELTEKQFKNIIENYVEEASTEKLHKLVYKLLKSYTVFDGCDLTPFKLLIDKKIYEYDNNDEGNENETN